MNLPSWKAKKVMPLAPSGRSLVMRKVPGAKLLKIEAALLKGFPPHSSRGSPELAAGVAREVHLSWRRTIRWLDDNPNSIEALWVAAD